MKLPIHNNGEATTTAAGKLERAISTSFGRPVTAYLTDCRFVAGCGLGITYGHVRKDMYGRFADGHRIRTSQVVEAHRSGEFWLLHTYSGSMYVVVTFQEEGGLESLYTMLTIPLNGLHPAPPSVH